ncbi:MAG: hypothetical protein Q7R48_01225 [bacterium]|nr:hypothetical protein [bacterium]
MIEILEQLKDGILDALFPAACASCGTEGTYICATCQVFVSEAALACPVCQDSSAFGTRHRHCEFSDALDGHVGVWEYEGVMRRLLSQIRERGMTHAVSDLVKRALGVMARDERFTEFFSFLLQLDISIVPVPMEITQEKKQGFSLAKVIAQELSGLLEKHYAPDVLLRTRRFEDALSREARLQNPIGVFRYGTHDALAGALLVDDFWMSGTTMQECCRVLKGSGVKEVWGFTLARATSF